MEDEDDTPPDGSPANKLVDVRSPGQKAQRAAKKKCKQDDTSQLLEQMKRIAYQEDRDLKYRLSLKKEAQLAEQRADDSTTMTVDPSSPLREYWEKKKAKIIERDEQESSARRRTPSTLHTI